MRHSFTRITSSNPSTLKQSSNKKKEKNRKKNFSMSVKKIHDKFVSKNMISKLMMI